MPKAQFGSFRGDTAYTERIFHGGNRLTRWSHRRRSSADTTILAGRRYERVADVGAADGWFLRALIDAGIAERATGIDVDPDEVDAGRTRSANHPTLDFVLADSEGLEPLRHSFDLVVCLATLEHVEDPTSVLDTVVSLTQPGGEALIEVPVEVGPALLVKQAARWAANRGGDYGYERYGWRELVKAGVLWQTDGIERINLHSHKGFDYRAMRRLVAERVVIDRTRWSPVTMLGPVAASAVTWLGHTPAVTTMAAEVDPARQAAAPSAAVEGARARDQSPSSRS